MASLASGIRTKKNQFRGPILNHQIIDLVDLLILNLDTVLEFFAFDLTNFTATVLYRSLTLVTFYTSEGRQVSQQMTNCKKI